MEKEQIKNKLIEYQKQYHLCISFFNYELVIIHDGIQFSIYYHDIQSIEIKNNILGIILSESRMCKIKLKLIERCFGE